jgi:hypothetical protein
MTMTAPPPRTWRHRPSKPGTPGCPARRHGTWYAYERYGCRCPDIVARVRATKSWRRGPDVPSTVQPLKDPRNGQPDEVAVLRVLTGERMPLTTADRNAAIDELDRRGLSAAQIARQIGCAQRTVVRRRHARNTADQHAA